MTRSSAVALPMIAALVLLGPGCLFTGGLNTVPEVVLEVDTAGPYVIGEEVWLSARSTIEPDGDELTYHWDVILPLGASASAAGPCALPPPAGAADFCFVPRDHLDFDVMVTATDEHGAFGQATQRISVANRAPSACLTVLSVPKPNNHFTAGREIWIHSLCSADLDEDPLTHTWQVSRPAGSVTANFVFEEADADRNPTSDPALASFARMVPDYPGTYRVSLTVDDGELDDTTEVTVEVDPDEAPCISATAPDHALEKLVFSPAEIRRLEVTGVSDDLDPYPGGATGQTVFRWQIRDDLSQPFFAIDGYRLAYLDLDGAAFSVGQTIQVRVIAEDRVMRDLSACSVDDRRCALTASCYQWVTWQIEFR